MRKKASVFINLLKEKFTPWQIGASCRIPGIPSVWPAVMVTVVENQATLTKISSSHVKNLKVSNHLEKFEGIFAAKK